MKLLPDSTGPATTARIVAALIVFAVVALMAGLALHTLGAGAHSPTILFLLAAAGVSGFYVLRKGW